MVLNPLFSIKMYAPNNNPSGSFVRLIIKVKYLGVYCECNLVLKIAYHQLLANISHGKAISKTIRRK